MGRIHIPAVGFACGAASALTYVACVAVMAVVPRDTMVRFFNSLLHGLDVGPILRHEISLGEAAVGVVEIFILGWLFGAIVAAFYNIAPKKSQT